LSKVDGVLRTDTHITFRSYSRRDTDAAFSLGLDEGADGRAPIHMGGTTRKRWFWDFQGAEARGRGARR